MSNLSDLLPAGGGAKVITATADGNLATGQTVALQSNGTVKAIAANGLPEALGSQTVFSTASTTRIASCYDPDTGKTIIAYRGASNYGYALVATPASDNSITFGTPVTFLSGTLTEVALSYDTGQDKVLLVYSDGADGNKLKAITGTVSGTSISFSSSSTAETNSSENIAVAYSPDSENHMVIYADGGNSDRGAARVIAVSGAGAPTTYNVAEVLYNGSNTTQSQDVVYDTTQNKFIVFYRDAGNSYYGECAVGSISGTTITFGTSVVLNSDNTTDIALAFDSSNEKTVVLYKAGQDPRSRVISVSGTTPSAGSETVIVSLSGSGQYDLVYDSSAGKLIAIFDNEDDSEGEYAVGTVSGTSITYLTPVTFNSDGRAKYNGASFNASVNKVVLAFEDIGNSSYGTAQVLQMIGTNSQDFVGITNQAINNSASGEVVVEGGVITNSSMFTPVVSAGTPVNFANTNVAQSGAIAFDSTNNKVVIVYTPSANSNYGTAIVGTVSGDTISFGSPVVFNSADTDHICIAFDANAGKFVIGYKDNGASNYGKAIVGTVSGTSISFGSEAALEDAVVSGLSATYDANAQKVVIAYYNNSASRAAVGTVSGTSVSFGTPVTFSSSTSTYQSITYDSSAQKVVIAFTDSTNSNYPSGIVGTVSGTSISFGSATAVGSEGGAPVSIAYDSSNSKVVIAYKELASSPYGLRAVAGTVSGTSISFGSTASAEDTDGVSNPSIAYDASAQQMVIAYRSEGSGTPPKVIPAGVSGTSVTFGSAVTITSDAGSFYTNGHNLTYDSNAQRVVGHYIDSYAGNLGDAFVVDTTSTFTIGSTYYVQDDGTLSTTASSVTAGKAIANTTLLLKG